MREIRSRATIGNMRIVAGVLCVSLSACSFGMKRVETGWDGSTEPECSDDPTPVIGDVIVAGLALGIGTAAADSADMSSGSAGVAVAGLFVGLGFAVSALVGNSTYKECKEAKAQWRIGGAIGRASNAQRAPTAGDETADDVETVDDTEPPQPKKKKPPAEPRGFYCSASEASPDIGFCVREKSECLHMRDVSIAAVNDLTQCALVESAWCFGKRCAVTHEACRAELQRAQGDEIDCVEER